jgi:hypothetical protein
MLVTLWWLVALLVDVVMPLVVALVGLEQAHYL